MPDKPETSFRPLWTDRSTTLSTTNLQRRIRTLLAAMVFALSLSIAPSARAQNELPVSVVQSTSLSGSQKEEVARYAAAALTLFKSSDWSETRRGRDQLLRPLEDPQSAASVSVSFRLEYSRELVPALSSLAAKGNPDLTRLNAIRILGSIATAQSASAIEPFLSDEASAIKFMACQASGNTFRVLAASSPALPSGEAVRLVNRLAALAGAEADTTVLDGAVIGLIEATKVDIANYTEVREGAFLKLAQAMSTRLQALPADSQDSAMLATILRAGVAARDGLIGRTELGNGVVRELAGFGGDLLAYVMRRTQAGHLPAPGAGTLRSALEQLASTGEANVFYALLSLDRGNRIEPTAISATLQDGRATTDAEFVAQAAVFIREKVVAPPVGLPADRFLK